MKTFNQYIAEAVEFLDWKEINQIIKKGYVMTVQPWGQDVSWKMKRTSGKLHADVEPNTASDTKKMKDVMGFGSEFKDATYTPVVVKVDNRKFAAALMNVPHAGSTTTPLGKNAKNLSGGISNVANSNYIKYNEVTGHFCLHFRGSIRHTDNETDSKAQNAINLIRVADGT